MWIGQVYRLLATWIGQVDRMAHASLDTVGKILYIECHVTLAPFGMWDGMH